jgi:triosephosphate isomerase
MKKLIVANWKMNPQTAEEAKRLFVETEHRMHPLSDKVETVVCTPYVFLPMLSHYSHYARLGAQDMSEHEHGAYTGEVSGSQLKIWNVNYVIVGHSERRLYYGETDASVKLKIDSALKHRITPIVCLGGDAKANMEKMKPLVAKQFASAVKGLQRYQIGKLVFAYEPTWAISSTKNSKSATGEHAVELINHIRSLIAKHAGLESAESTPVLYGGTVHTGNVSEYARHPEISGALVGSASLDSTGFFEIIKEFHRESIHRS